MQMKLIFAATAALAGLAASAADLTVTSENSPYVIDSPQTFATVVVKGGGELIVTNKATLSAGYLTVGLSGSKGTLTVTDGSTVTVTETGGEKDKAPFRVAYDANSEGRVNLLDGSTLTTTHAIISYQGQAKSTVTISNALLKVSNSIFNTRNALDAVATNSVFVLRKGGVLDFNSFTRNSPKTCTVVQFDGGSCTNRSFWASLDGGWLILEGVNGNPIDYAVITSNAENGYFVLNGGTPSFGHPHVHLTGNGGVRLFSNQNRKAATIWGTVPVPADLTSDYTGDLVIRAKRLTQTAPNQMFSATNRVILEGLDGLTSVLDLNGFDASCAAIVERERCYVLNPANCSAATLTIGTGDGDSVLKTLLCQSPVTVQKVGKGTLDLYPDSGSGHASALTIRAGSVNLSSRSVCGYKVYKWIINDTYGKNPKQDYARMAEIELFDANGEKVNLAMTAGENSSYLKDGNPASDQFFERAKFDGRMPYFTFSFPVPTPVAGYRWATGCDYGTETKWGGRTEPGYNVDIVPPAYDVSMCRDPSDWTVYGSNDGYSWVEIGKETNFKAPNNRWTWTGTFALDYDSPLTEGALKIYPGATLNVKSGKRLVFSSVENYGTINYAEGVTVVLDNPTEAFVNLLDTGTGSAALEKTGAGEATVVGTRPATGSVKVSEGTLRLGINGGVAQKYWRWRIKGTRNWWWDPDPKKWEPYKTYPGAAYEADHVFAGELALYDRDGNRVNLLSQGTTVISTDVEYPSSNFNLLLDGRTDTYAVFAFTGTSTAYANIPRIKKDDPTTWKGFVFKLSAEAKNVFSYDISTAWDHTDRDPTAWDFAVSDDGENWTIIEDHEEDPTEFLVRLHDPNRNKFGMFNEGRRGQFRKGLAVIDTTCYSPETEVSVGAGASLVLPGATTVTGALRVDAAQGTAGTINLLNFAPNGVMTVENFTRFAGGSLALPLKVEESAGETNLNTWQLILNGLPSSKYLLSVVDGYLTLGKTGMILLLR